MDDFAEPQMHKIQLNEGQGIVAVSEGDHGGGEIRALTRLAVQQLPDGAVGININAGNRSALVCYLMLNGDIVEQLGAIFAKCVARGRHGVELQ